MSNGKPGHGPLSPPASLGSPEPAGRRPLNLGIRGVKTGEQARAGHLVDDPLAVPPGRLAWRHEEG